MSAVAAAAVLPAAPSGVRLTSDNPWPGLAAYDEDSSSYFKGRRSEKLELLRLVTQFPHVALYGKSGLGKSSLLQAGLFPLLREKKTYLPVYVRLNLHADSPLPPMAQAMQALQDALCSSGAEFTEPAKGESIWHYLHRRDLELWSVDNYPLTPVLVFDQFEELFAPRQGGFFDAASVMNALGDLIESRLPEELSGVTVERSRLSALDLQTQRYRTLISFREDYLPILKNWERGIPSLLRNFLALRPMSRSQATEAVKEPGERVLAPGIEHDIVEFVGNLDNDTQAVDAEVAIEPVLLSLCCTQLNTRRAAGRLIDADLLMSSGADILQDFYRCALAGMPDRVPRFIEGHLVQGKRYRASYPVDLAVQDGHLHRDELALLTDKRRLLRVDPQSGVDRVELIHDRLVGVVVAARDLRMSEAAAEAAEAQRQRDREVAEAAAEGVRRRAEALRLKKDRNRLIVALGLTSAFALFAVVQSVRLQGRTEEADAAAATATRAASQAQAAAAEAQVQRNIAHQQTALAQALAQKAVEQQENERRLRATADEQRDRAEAAERKSAAVMRQAVALRVATEGQATLAGVRPGSDRQALLMLVAAHRIAPELPAVKGQLLETIKSTARMERLIETGSRTAIFTPDGRGMVRVDSAGRIGMLDLAKGAWRGLYAGALDAAPAAAAGDGSSATSQVIAISRDGRRVAVSDDFNVVGLWDAQSGKLIARMEGHENTVHALAFSPDGALLVSGDEDGTLRWWRTEDGRETGTWSDPKATSIYSVAFSPDGKLLASGADEGQIRFYDAPGRAAPGLGALVHGEGAVRALAFSFDGQRLASGGDDKALRIWDVASGKRLHSVTAHEDAITSVAFNSDGRVASASDDKLVRVWQGERRVAELRGHDSAVRHVAFSPDGARLLSTGDDGTGRVWLARTWIPGESLFRAFRPVSLVRFDEDGIAVSVVQDDLTSLTWDITGSRMNRPTTRMDGGPWTPVAFGPGKRVVGSDSRGSLIVWDFEKRAPALSIPAHAARARSVAYSPDGDRIASIGSDNVLKVWDGRSGELLAQSVQLPAQATRLAFSATGYRIAVGLQDGDLLLYDSRTAARIGRPLSGHSAAVSALAFHEERLASADSRGNVLIRTVRGPTQPSLPLAGHVGRVNALAFSPDGLMLASGGEDSTVRLWNSRSGESVGIPLKGHVSLSLAFGKDGVIASAGRDRTVRLWPVFPRWLGLLCSKVDPDLSAEEWSQLVSQDIGYVKPCTATGPG
ncbi:WD40 repeat domain-containing protein [Aquabacterium humicola]|uniref:WD40 repeat domain-containing protein n=1 Tax=Aquabacterium humicola TaxID=3237377 RepID=UPI0025429905|nr:WD40 repeat domain-containing protein [Rubrivivax pictus]